MTRRPTPPWARAVGTAIGALTLLLVVLLLAWGVVAVAGAISDAL